MSRQHRQNAPVPRAPPPGNAAGRPAGDPAMNARTDHLDAQDALPWLANGTLAGAELERVQAHVATCAHCRADLALLRTVHAAGPGPDLDFDPDRALARLMPQLDAPQLDAAPPQAKTGLLQRWRDRVAANDRTWPRC
ncbi:zf-HC2 domain-containing protein [Massilia sp. CT11-108]|uniref:zf-HC2 domain-containing protein n=1 Tax=Massilia sp. CT11-108 TaxID=3393900 RepID=UPI0039A46C9E